MAEEPQQDAVTEGSDGAKQAAQERMKAALDAQKRGEEIEVDTASLEATTADAATSGASDSSGNKDKGKGDGKTIDQVKIYSPFHVYYDGPAESVSAENLTGPFDILHDHKNFMSLLTPSEVVVRHARGEERVKIDRGVMHVSENRVFIFLDV